MPAKRTRSWLEVAFVNAGARQGLRGMSWVISWGAARVALGHDPSAEEVAKWWKDAERTAYREQAAFREAFPQLETPALIFENPEAAALIKQFVNSVTKLGALKQVRGLEEATIRIGYLPAQIEE